MADCIAIIRGIPHIPSITEVNVRSGPGTNSDLAFTVPVGMDSLKILDIQPDAEGKAKDGKLYQWFKLTFHGGAVGWVRDDLIDLTGDCGGQGYGSYTERTFAFVQVRTETTVVTVAQAVSPSAPAPTISVVAPAPSQPEPTPPAPAPAMPAPTVPAPAPVNPAPVAVDTPPLDAAGLERVRRAAFSITQAFEGKGYPAYQNYDTGVVSYGRFQFTLAAGSLGTVVKRYVERSLTPTADQLRNEYLPRVLGRDEQLRQDTRFRDLLVAAANEDVMKRVQNEVASEGYWSRMLTLSAQSRGIVLPLSLALLFDIAINFGVMHGLLTAAEGEFGAPQKSKVGQNGVTEQQLIARVADIRKRSHDRQAERDNLPGLRVRGDFWVSLIASGDWQMQGDADGNIKVKGQPLQVRNPSEF
ncbi:MAG: SH3 domain-containing protein [Anaerolineae bacterium]|jgi:hypothetical protein|nr:SH3 domain-containing protein [Anaerolineae bacterium]